MSRIIVPGSISQSVIIHLDLSAGGDAIGKVAADLSAGYWRPGMAATLGISLVDLSTLDQAYSSGGVKHVNYGDYRLDLPDAAIADGVDYVIVFLNGTGILQTGGGHVIDLWAGGKLNKQPRINTPAGKSFRHALSSRSDGTHKATRPARIRPGTVGSIDVSLDVSPLFDRHLVDSVGTPTVSPTGDITVAAAGPRDTEAMVTLDGTATAGSTYVVTVPVTMDSGESINAVFDVAVFDD